MAGLKEMNLKRFSREPFWIALAFVGALVFAIVAGAYVSGITGIIIAMAPLALLLLILCLVNPYPFWLIYFILTPFTYLVQELFPTGSFVRFAGLILVALTIPSILLSKRSPRFKVTALGGSILLFFTGCVLSLLAFFELGPAFMGVGLFLGNIMAYWVFVNIFATEKRLRTVLDVLITVLAIEAVIAVVQKMVGVPLLRATGTLVDPNAFGFWLLPFLCFAFYFGLAARKRWQKLLYFGAYLVMTVAIPLTYSRSMILVLLPVQFILYWRQKKLHIFALVAAASIALLYLGFAKVFTYGFDIKSFFTAARAASIDWRFYFAKTAVRMFVDNPILGVGADCFYHKFRFYSTITPHIAKEVIHNSYLEILSGTGLVGFLPFLAVIFFSLRNLWLTRKHYTTQGDHSRSLMTEGLIVGFIASLLAHLFLSTQHHILLWLAIAIATIVANNSFRMLEARQGPEKGSSSPAH
ncbi:MAG: O-antigen ligase family protein [Candidatus Stahlbacteria bacterium]|nr:MAG: O-antigen ligase family protein [Candidatus Stahlbacteria bacterium]